MEWKGRSGKSEANLPQLNEDSSITELTMPAVIRKSAVWFVFFFTIPAIALTIVSFIRGDHVVGNLVWLGGAVVIAVLGLRLLQMGVMMVSDEVVVRNLFSTNRIPLVAITGVEPRTGWGANVQHGQERRVFLIVGDQRTKVDALASSDAMVRKVNAERLRSFLHP